MKSVSISGSLRENVGKRDAKEQRAKGMIPCVLYGGVEQCQFVVGKDQFRHLLYTPEVFYADLILGNKECKAIVQDTQFHPITDDLLHVDFLEVIEGKSITIEIPVHIIGISPGVLRGGKLSKKVRKLKVKGELKDIPEHIMVDISCLDINENIKINALSVPNIEFLEIPTKIVVSVLSTRNVEATQTEA